MNKMSYRLYLPCLMVAVMAMTACGCIITDSLFSLGSKDAPVTTESDAKARVQAWWQEFMAKELVKNSEAEEAYGLFSEGGFAGAGQLMVIAGGEGGGATLLDAVASARPRDPTRKDLNADVLGSFRQTIEGLLNLEDVNETMFDGVVYEFVHAVKADDGRIRIENRIYISKSGAAEHPDHDRLIRAFNDLKRLR